MKTESAVEADHNDLQLCFSKSHFNRQDFDVDRFVSLARRRVTLDQIQLDLRTYLRYLQNSMVELINDDYADFVNLSSNLAALKESINKVSSNFETTWTNFKTSINDIRTVAEFVDSRCVTLEINRAEQIIIRDKISLLLSIERLSKGMQKKSTCLTSWLLNLVNLVVDVELCYGKISEKEIPGQASEARENCYDKLTVFLVETLIEDLRGKCLHVKAILLLLSLTDHVDFAVLKIADSVVNMEIEEYLTDKSLSKDRLLHVLFKQILLLREKWILQLEKQCQFSKKCEDFLDKSLLKYCSNFLDENFGSVLVPSDNLLFRKCYLITVKFIEDYPNASCVDILKFILNKFSTLVYFKMATQQSLCGIRTQAKFRNLKEIFETESKHQLRISNSALHSIRSMFSDDIYIPVLADKIWDFTLKIMEIYAEWLKNFVSQLAKEPEEKDSAIEAWIALIWILQDTKLFLVKLTTFFEEKICPKWTCLDVDLQPFRDCIAFFAQEMETNRTRMFENIVDLLTIKTTKELGGVSDIHRQYRWTKKPSPTVHSQYLKTYSSIYRTVEEKAREVGWHPDEFVKLFKQMIERALNVFCEKAEQILMLVEQTGSSLQRLQQRKAGIQEENNSATVANLPETDEAKIRSQLILDIKFMMQHGTEYGISLERLHTLQSRAQADAS